MVKSSTIRADEGEGSRIALISTSFCLSHIIRRVIQVPFTLVLLSTNYCQLTFAQLSSLPILRPCHGHSTLTNHHGVVSR